jgi:hypothetical protein
MKTQVMIMMIENQALINFQYKSIMPNLRLLLKRIKGLFK